MENGKINFKIGRKSSSFTIGMLCISLFICFCNTLIGLFRILMLTKFERGNLLTSTEVFFAENLFSILLLGQIFVTLLTLIPFSIWIHRAYKNLISFGVKGLQYSPGWAVGYFYMPILNIVYPPKVAHEIWNASDPLNLTGEVKNWVEVGKSKIVSTWWLFVLLTGIINNSSNILFNKRENNNPMIITGIVIISEITWIIAGVFAILLITQINKRQKEKFEKMNSQCVASENNISI
jgi:hypothetical protein